MGRPVSAGVPSALQGLQLKTPSLQATIAALPTHDYAHGATNVAERAFDHAEARARAMHENAVARASQRHGMGGEPAEDAADTVGPRQGLRHRRPPDLPRGRRDGKK